MLYQIIKTKTSADEKICYSIFRRPLTVDTVTADTYGIIAADFNESYSVDDIFTDENKVKQLLKSLCEKSITPKEFLHYVIHYIDKN